MASRIRRKGQAEFNRDALRKLKSTGLYTGKLDLRRKPTKYQKSLIKKYSDVVSGKAAVLTPTDPKSYKRLFRVKGDKVIVPKRKGERVSTNKAGEIVTSRKVGGRTIKSKFRRVGKSVKIEKPAQPTFYFVPFIRGRTASGKPVLDWKRFPTWEALNSFVHQYEQPDENDKPRYRDIRDYIIEETQDIPELERERRLTPILAERGLAPAFDDERGSGVSKRKRKRGARKRK